METGRKIGNIVGSVKDVLVMDSGRKDVRYLCVLVDQDLTKPLLRGTRLRYKNIEAWAKFKYEQLPIFCFYCGTIGHHERMCLTRKQDVDQNRVLKEQFGGWLRASHRRGEGWGNRSHGTGLLSEGSKMCKWRGENIVMGRE